MTWWKELCHFHRDRQSHQFSRQKPRSSFLSQWRWYEPREDAKWEYRFKGVSEKTGNKLSQLYQPVLRRRRRSDDPAAFKCSTRFAPQDTLQLHWDVSGAFRPIRDGLEIPTGFFLTRRRSPDDLAP
ncbi:uncharacterized protein LOC9659853 [Selaginella moellendorffii]|uniref:uncharacterized protein LOC9659853 n=1 Tax=Selaginella moellendorffii TaxID=88036 RepID=UPI000D1C4915|nr:uncharacterized protein LOC9659853 [Selaginella moellendorffii]|eukprot:XP_024516207.1 uncharacterized protein LOC9659853 [Selaginella moellendorffii]